MYYERRRAEAVWTAGRDRDVFRGLGFENKLNTHNCVCVLLLQDLLQRCSRGGGRRGRTCVCVPFIIMNQNPSRRRRIREIL
jgi:hypothetical protein